ncbi:MAG: ROK family protein [Cyanobacteria bacterium P01_A01_bin.105]
MTRFGAVEAGGTKFVCAVGTGPADIQETIRIPTTTPTETIAQVVDFFKQQNHTGAALQAIGVGAFGPVDTHPDSPSFGWFLETPKPGWQQIEFAGVLAQALAVPVGFDTDVNAAALGEGRWGQGQGLDTFLYLTVGTGIGGGAVVNGKLLHGLLHPEMGHILIPHDRTVDPFPGSCPFHQDCLEGLASGFALEQRWQTKAANLPADHPAWALEASYLAAGIVNYILTLSPQRVIVGGGVMAQPHLLPLVRTQVMQKLNGYLKVPQIERDIETYIVAPGLGERSGITGAFALAIQAAEEDGAKIITQHSPKTCPTTLTNLY